MKRLMFMISTHGKSPGQAAKEAWQAYQKYRKVEAEIYFLPTYKQMESQVSQEVSQQKPTEQTPKYPKKELKKDI